MWFQAILLLSGYSNFLGDANLYTWGINQDGQLGYSTDQEPSYAPKVCLPDIREVVCTDQATIVLKSKYVIMPTHYRIFLETGEVFSFGSPQPPVLGYECYEEFQVDPLPITTLPSDINTISASLTDVVAISGIAKHFVLQRKTFWCRQWTNVFLGE